MNPAKSEESLARAFKAKLEARTAIMNSRRDPNRNELHERNMDYTIKELQRQIREREQELARVCSRGAKSDDSQVTESTENSYAPRPRGCHRPAHRQKDLV